MLTKCAPTPTWVPQGPQGGPGTLFLTIWGSLFDLTLHRSHKRTCTVVLRCGSFFLRSHWSHLRSHFPARWLVLALCLRRFPVLASTGHININPIRFACTRRPSDFVLCFSGTLPTSIHQTCPYGQGGMLSFFHQGTCDFR